MVSKKFLLYILLMASLFTHTKAFAVYPTESIDMRIGIKDFVVGPGKQDLFLKPGEEVEVEIMVSNRLGEARTFELNVEDFKGSRDINKTIEFLGEETGPFSLKKYISFEEKTFTLESGTRARIPVRIKIPLNAEPGGLHGGLMVSTVKSPTQLGNVEQGKATGGVPLNIRQSVLFFVRVAGDVLEDGRMVDFNILNNKTLFGDNEDIRFQIIFENNGSVHLSPSGKIFVYNSVGLEAFKVVLEPWFTMPDSLRSIERKLNTQSMFGRYTATANIYRGYGALDDIASYDELSLSFWVVPWSKVAWSLLIIILIIAFIWWFRRNFELEEREE